MHWFYYFREEEKINTRVGGLDNPFAVLVRPARVCEVKENEEKVFCCYFQATG